MPSAGARLLEAVRFSGVPVSEVALSEVAPSEVAPSGVNRSERVDGTRLLADARPEPGRGCPVLDWAASGAMWLTGWPDRPPQWPAGEVIGSLRVAAVLLTALARSMGTDPGPLDIGRLLTDRAGARGRTRRGSVSVGGRSRILETADGWLAVTLARPDDVGLLPALSSGAIVVDRDGPVGTVDAPDDGIPDDIWRRLERHASSRPAVELMEAAQRIGLPAAEVVTRPAPVSPWSVERAGESVSTAPRPLRVLDLSAMWAGPLCAHLLGRCGAEVTKVEDVARPDAARRGDPWLFEELHAGHEEVVLDFHGKAGRRRLGELVEQSDVVIEASRPRALEQLGLVPGPFLTSRPGRTWVSITGFGRSGPRSNWVAFGDDAAAGGGLVACADLEAAGDAEPPKGPVFCADAVADPITGLYAATGALISIAVGGGHLVECAMTTASAFANRGTRCSGKHRVERRGADWVACHDSEWRRVDPPRLPATWSH